MSFVDVYEQLRVSQTVRVDEGQVYVEAVEPTGFYVGRSGSGQATLLIECRHFGPNAGVSYRLKGLAANTQMRMTMRMADGVERAFSGGVLSLHSLDEDDVRYFLSVCESLANVLGKYPSEGEVLDAFTRVFAIFEKLQDPAKNSVSGIIGELLFIAAAEDVRRAIQGWRLQVNDRFDFVFPETRVDVKTSLTRQRKHSVALDQTSVGESKTVYFASILLESIPNGYSGHDLLDNVLEGCRGFPDDQMRVREVVAQTLGRDLQSYLAFNFDLESALASIRVYRHDKIPAIREQPPVGVSNIRFLSDFSVSTEFTGVREFWH